MRRALSCVAALIAAAAFAQQKTVDVVPVNCVVIVGNQTTYPEDEDGSFVATNVPSANPLRAQLTCTEADGGLTGAVTEQFGSTPGGIVAAGPFGPRQPLPPLPDHLVVTPDHLVLTVGESARLEVQSIGPSGFADPVTALATFRSGSPAVKVEGTGRVTGMAAGEALIGISLLGRVKVITATVVGSLDQPHSFTYVPDQRCVELKSLKLYLQRFRNEGIFYEMVINRIMDDFAAACRPRRLTVVGAFTPRGGITTTVTCRYEAAR